MRLIDQILECSSRTLPPDRRLRRAQTSTSSDFDVLSRVAEPSGGQPHGLWSARSKDLFLEQ